MGTDDLHLRNTQFIIEVGFRHGDAIDCATGQVLSVPQPGFERILQLGIVGKRHQMVPLNLRNLRWSGSSHQRRMNLISRCLLASAKPD